MDYFDMLIKQSFTASLLVGLISSHSFAQAPLWFDQSFKPTWPPAAVQPHAAQPQPQPPWMSAGTAPTPAGSNALQLTPWTALPKAVTGPAQATPFPIATPTNLADVFRNPASKSLSLKPAPEQADAPDKKRSLPLPQKLAQSTGQVAVQSQVQPRVSTTLSAHALDCGETDSAFHWPAVVSGATADRSFLAVAAGEVEEPEQESLILATDTASKTLSTSEVQAPEKEKSEKKEDDEENDKDPNPADSKKASTVKFETSAMVGPLINAPKLFSMLDVTDNFQGYAAPVFANRTRSLDSPVQAPWGSEGYTWISPVFCHKPLYFEQSNLERYGQGTCRLFQPTASSIHFFGTIPLLPYKILTQHPCEKHYTLGNLRPGNCNPVQKGMILGQSYVGEVREYWRPGSGY